MSKWVKPVFNRTSGNARMTYKDMNRITGNIDFLLDNLGLVGLAPVNEQEGTLYTYEGKTEWTQNDIISVNDWTLILEGFQHVVDAVGYDPETDPDYDMGWENINNIERILWLMHRIAFDGYGYGAHFCGDGFQTGDGIYCGGVYRNRWVTPAKYFGEDYYCSANGEVYSGGIY